MKIIHCHQCRKEVDKETKALNRKLIARDIKDFLCLDCLADHLGATKDDLLVKIEEFKEQGCDLF
jgi:biotin operon repressor